MQAIETKFLAPTNSRGLRYKATCAAGTVTVAADYSVNPACNHIFAAAALRNKLGWTAENGYNQEFASGSLKNGNYVHVFVGHQENT